MSSVHKGIRVAVNGYGVIGKRVADAVAKRGDMQLAGVEVAARYVAETEARLADISTAGRSPVQIG